MLRNDPGGNRRGALKFFQWKFSGCSLEKRPGERGGPGGGKEAVKPKKKKDFRGGFGVESLKNKKAQKKTIQKGGFGRTESHSVKKQRVWPVGKAEKAKRRRSGKPDGGPYAGRRK